MTENQAFYCGVQCVVMRVKRSSKKVLLGCRDKTTAQGQWALPGGHVEWNEPPLATARRELHEETGLTGLDADVGPSFITYSTNLPYVHVPVFFNEVSGNPQLIDGERFSALRYFSLQALPRPLFEPSRIALSLLGAGSLASVFGGESGSSYVKIDMVSVEPGENRNRFFSILFVIHKEQASFVVSWGRRDHQHRFVRADSVGSVEEGTKRLARLIAKRTKHGYLVVGVSGDLPLDKVANLIPDAEHLRVVSDELLVRLIDDPDFRSGYSQDFYLHNRQLPIGELATNPHQLTLF